MGKTWTLNGVVTQHFTLMVSVFNNSLLVAGISLPTYLSSSSGGLTPTDKLP